MKNGNPPNMVGRTAERLQIWCFLIVTVQSPGRLTKLPHRLGGRNLRRKIGREPEESARSGTTPALPSTVDDRGLRWNGARLF